MERRIAPDGRAHTYNPFWEYYREQGEEKLAAAPPTISLRSIAPQKPRSPTHPRGADTPSTAGRAPPATEQQFARDGCHGASGLGATPLRPPGLDLPLHGPAGIPDQREGAPILACGLAKQMDACLVWRILAAASPGEALVPGPRERVDGGAPGLELPLRAPPGLPDQREGTPRDARDLARQVDYCLVWRMLPAASPGEALVPEPRERVDGGTDPT